MQHSIVQYSTAYYTTVQYSKEQYSTEQYILHCAVQYTIHYNTLHCANVQYLPALCEGHILGVLHEHGDDFFGGVEGLLLLYRSGT
jgi:hypothetical protein